MINPLRMAVSLTALFAFSTPSIADITAADIWDDWKAMAAQSGATVTAGDEVDTGSGLTLRDVSVVMDFPEGGMSGTIPQIVLSESGGQVTITTSPEYRMDFTMTPVEGPGGTFSMIIAQPDARVIASGSPEDVIYNYDVPALSITMDGINIEDDPFDFDMAIELTDTVGVYRTLEGDLRRIDSDFRAAAVAMALSGEDPGGSGEGIEMSMTMVDLAAASSGTLSALGSVGDMGALLSQGLTSSGTFNHGLLTYQLLANTPDGSFDITGTSETGRLDFSLSEEGLSYGSSNTGVAMQFSSAMAPIGPVEVTMEETGGRLTLPMVPSDEPQDLGFEARLIGLTVGDPIWSMVDPAGMLPRDPATLVIDVSGQGNWLIDILDPEAIEEADEMPGELQSITLNALVLEAVGARVSAMGAFDFDNSGGMPQPAGAVDVTIEGANGLIDTLIAMGLVPEDQAMGARMMLGLFAQPGEGPDTLVSNIVVQPDGAVLANGQRIR